MSERRKVGSEVHDEILRQLNQLPEHPSADEIRHIVVDLRREYSGFAQRNAGRLDRINALYHRLVRTVVVIGVVFAVMQLAIGLFGVGLQSDTNRSSQQAASAASNAVRALRQIQEGRRIATKFSCSALSAVSLAGERVISGSGGTETPLARFLEQHGYPPPKIRQRQARLAARAYQQEINRRIFSTVGPKAKGLVQKDGTFNCTRLAKLSAVNSSHTFSP